MNKRAQATLWIIIAIFIVSMLLLLIFLRKTPITPNPVIKLDFKGQIEKCIRDSTNEAIDIMLPQGGFLRPDNFKYYMGTNVTFLCQNKGYFKPCISQHPMLINEEISEIENYIQPRIQNCYNLVKADYQSRQFSIDMQPIVTNVSLGPGRVNILVSGKINIEKANNSQSFDNINLVIENPIYDLSEVAMEIASQEAKYCYFEYVGYMILYPDIKISKFTFSDSTKIYTIEDKSSKKIMNIATRSCAISPGI